MSLPLSVSLEQLFNSLSSTVYGSLSALSLRSYNTNCIIIAEQRLSNFVMVAWLTCYLYLSLSLYVCSTLCLSLRHSWKVIQQFGQHCMLQSLRSFSPLIHFLSNCSLWALNLALFLSLSQCLPLSLSLSIPLTPSLTQLVAQNVSLPQFN